MRKPHWPRLKNELTAGLVGVLIIIGLFGQVGSTGAVSPFDDLTPNHLTFTGRRGASYTASWDPATYTVTFATPDGRFPWDWISFVGQAGSLSLNGYPEVGSTFALSNPDALSGAQPGDLIRVKGQGVLGLAHLTKLGLVIGSGANAQRAWLSAGMIDQYVVAPEYVGYRVQVLDRTAEVRLSSLNPVSGYSVGLVEVRLDNPANARLVFASDLEPAMDYSTAVEWHNRNDTYVSWDAANEAVVGTQGASNYPVYVYAGSALQSWSANNLRFDQYLGADSLDGQALGGASDGRVALSVNAQALQYFYIGSQVLDSATRRDPAGALDSLRAERVAELDQLPVVESLNLPRFKFVNLLSNLILTYLINPNGGLFYTDKAFIYTPDALMPLLVTPHLLPAGILSAYRDGLNTLAANKYSASSGGNYGRKIDTNRQAALPSGYGGNLPDIIDLKPDRSRFYREVYSDGYGTAEYINGVYRMFQVTGDLAFAQSQQTAVQAAVGGLQAFDNAYDSAYGQDGNRFPNLLVPMGDLGKIAGEYPGESAQALYAYDDAEQLYRLYGLDVQADDLQANYITPMRSAFDSTFWNASLSFYTPLADHNSQTRSPGTFYPDLWAHTVFVPLRGNLGDNRLGTMLSVMTGPAFTEPGDDMHWLAKGSENFATPGRWNLSANYTNGWGMEGGYLVLPNAIPALGYYQLGQVGTAEIYANRYLDKWVQYGPHETVMEWAGGMPGRFGESSLYIEASAATAWLLQEALDVQIDGTQVTVAPRISGQFVVRKLRVTSAGQTAVLDYARDAQGREWVNIRSNTGLQILTPQAGGSTNPTRTPTATGTPVANPPTPFPTPWTGDPRAFIFIPLVTQR